MTSVDHKVVRAESLGSLLQSERLLSARTRHASGEMSLGELREIEDSEVLRGDPTTRVARTRLITDGELRRSGWSAARTYLDGMELIKGPRSYPTNVNSAAQSDPEAAFPTVVRKVSPRPMPRSPRSIRSFTSMRTHARSTRWPHRVISVGSGPTQRRQRHTRTVRSTSNDVAAVDADHRGLVSRSGL